MNEAESHFLDLLEDLDGLLLAPSSYNNKRLSGILRQLLLDRVPLMDQVNQNYRLKILFTLGVLPPATPKIGSLTMGPIFPMRKDDPSSFEVMGRSAFLKRRCMLYHLHEFSILDIIKINAHVRGGVHLGKPHAVLERQAMQLVTTGPLIGYANGPVLDMTLGMIHEIGLVVRVALAELRTLASKAVLS